MKLIPVVAGVAIVATLAACSSSTSSSKSPAATQSGSSEASSSSAGPIKVGNIGSYTGPLSSSLAGTEQSIKAWGSSVNAAGGIDGRPIELFVKDDGGNPTAGLQAAKELVELDHVVAIVSDQSGVDQGFGAYVKSKGVPVVGGITISSTFLTNSDFFPSGTNTIALTYAGVLLAKQKGPKFGELYCAEAPTCKQGVAIFIAIGETVGSKLAYSASVSAAASDYTAVCQGMKQAGVSSYFVADGAAVVLRIADACAQQGVTAKLIPLGGIGTEDFLSHPGLDGAVGADIDFPLRTAPRLRLRPTKPH